MGRELKRKQAKKEGRNIKEIQTKNKDLNTIKPKTLFVILGVLLFFCVVLYFITSIFITKDINLSNNKKVIDYELSTVTFKELSEQSIKDYIGTKESLDKAGAYGIQGYGALLVEEIQGDYFNIVGLPISRLSDLLKKYFNINLFMEGDVSE